MPERADLFQAAMERRLAESRLRWPPVCVPQSLDDVVGQQHLLGAGRPLRALIEVGPTELGAALGTTRHREDDVGEPHSWCHQARLRRPVRRLRPG